MCDSFEGATLAADWLATATLSTVGPVNTCALRGSRALGLQINALGSNNMFEARVDTLAGATPSPPATWYIRAMFFVPAPLPPYQLSLLRLKQDGSPNEKLTVGLSATGTLDLSNSLNTPPTFLSGVSMPLGRWVCLELEVGVGNPGPVRLYVDGSRIVDSMQTTTGTVPLSRAIFGAAGATTPASWPAYTLYVDDVIISDAPVGCSR